MAIHEFSFAITRALLVAACSILFLDLCKTSAAAQSLEQFYKGKLVTFILGYPTGGANDGFGRTVSQFIGNHIPGEPNFVLRNMPGAGSLIAANHLFKVSPRDGSVIGMIAATAPLDELLGAPKEPLI